MKTWILSISVLANIVLGGHLLLGGWVQPARSGDGSLAYPTQASSARRLSPSDADADALLLRERLPQLGMSDEQTKRIVVAYLAARAAQGETREAYEYWRKSDRRTTSAAVASVEERQAAIRGALLEMYGDSARDDPAFATVFKPLNDRFPFLTSEQQIALMGLHAQRQNAGPRPPSPTSSAGVALAPDRATSTTFDSALRQLLPNPSSYLEYQMRESPLADRIRNTGVELTEAEYWQVFKVMHDFQSDPRPSAFVAQRQAVRSTLGRDRALEFWAATDPMFSALRDAARHHAVRDDALLAAYEVLLDAQDDLLSIADGPRDARHAEEIRDRLERRDRMLRDLLGDAAASSILEAQAARLGALRGTSPAPPPRAAH